MAAERTGPTAVREEWLRRGQWERLPAMLSIKQAQVVLGWGVNQTYRAARIGAIPTIRNGRGYSIPRDRLRAWIDTAGTSPPAEPEPPASCPR